MQTLNPKLKTFFFSIPLYFFTFARFLRFCLWLNKGKVITMDYLSKFSIPFVNLSYEVHRYEYDIDNVFFESFENSVIQQGKVHVTLDLNRQENMFILDFHTAGYFQFECDRCLGKFDYPIGERFSIIVKVTEETSEAQDDVVTISPHESNINIAQHLYDYLNLLLPYRKIHPDNEKGESTCDPEFLKTIDQLSHHEENHTDPRWAALNKLKK